MLLTLFGLSHFDETRNMELSVHLNYIIDRSVYKYINSLFDNSYRLIAANIVLVYDCCLPNLGKCMPAIYTVSQCYKNGS